jgi:hypothetical protein
MALNEADPLVEFKLNLLRTAMPAESAVVFGDMYIVEGGYTAKCVDYGCESALLIDTFETPGWLKTRLLYPQIDFYKADFSDPLFMASVREKFSIGVVFDILLHQAPLLATIHLMLERVTDAFVIAQPVLKERAEPNSLVYLPGQPDTKLYPLEAQSDQFRAFDVLNVNHTHWLWGITPSAFRSILAGEGFEIEHETVGWDFPNPEWNWWGCIARRTRENPAHWSRTQWPHGLYTRSW